MNIHTIKYLKFSCVAQVLDQDVNDLAECFSDSFTWGDAPITAISLPTFLSYLDVEQEEALIEALGNTIANAQEAQAYYVNLAE